MFKPRPGGGARVAKPIAPPRPPGRLAPPGQTRAIWPKRPQFCIRYNRLVSKAVLAREQDDARSTSGYHPAHASWDTQPGCDRRLRTSSTVCWRRYGEKGRLTTRGLAGGSCSRGAAQRSNSPRCGRLHTIAAVSGTQISHQMRQMYSRLPHLKQPFLENWYAMIFGR